MEIGFSDDINPEIGYFVYRKCMPDWNISACVTDFYDVTYVIDGTATYTIGEESHKVVRGDLLCVPSGVVRSAVTDPSNLMECYGVNFILHGVPKTATPFSLPLVNHVGIHPDIISMYGDLNNTWLRRSPGYKIKSKALLLLIFMCFYELILRKDDSNIIDYRIDKAARYITDRYYEDISIDSLAEMVGLNKNYFGVLFKNTMGMTFRQFLTAIRVNHAENLLMLGNTSITEAAVRCGFADVSYFSRVYKKSRGVPPSRAAM